MDWEKGTEVTKQNAAALRLILCNFEIVWLNLEQLFSSSALF